MLNSAKLEDAIKWSMFVLFTAIGFRAMHAMVTSGSWGWIAVVFPILLPFVMVLSIGLVYMMLHPSMEDHVKGVAYAKRWLAVLEFVEVRLAAYSQAEFPKINSFRDDVEGLRIRLESLEAGGCRLYEYLFFCLKAKLLLSKGRQIKRPWREGPRLLSELEKLNDSIAFDREDYPQLALFSAATDVLRERFKSGNAHSDFSRWETQVKSLLAEGRKLQAEVAFAQGELSLPHDIVNRRLKGLLGCKSVAYLIVCRPRRRFRWPRLSHHHV